MNKPPASILPRVLCLLQLPPPVHGSSMLGSWFHDGRITNAALRCDYVNTLGSTSLDDIGRLGVRKVWRSAALFLRVIRRLVTRRYDLCYFAITVKGPAFYRDAMIVMLLRLRGVRLVYHLHNKGVSTGQNHVWDDWLYRVVFRRAAVIVGSPRLYPDVASYVPFERVSMCPNGIPDGDHGERSRDGGQTVKMLFLANLIESKGVFVLLDACRILKEQGVDFHCTLAGGESDITAPMLQDRIKRDDLSGHVNYRGSQYGAEKAARFSEADIFVFPTYYHYECLPLVILEAMRYALPVVSTDEGGIPDIVLDGVTGFICPRRDPAAVAAKLRLLIGDEHLRRKLGEAGRERFQNEYTLDHYENRLVRILRTAAAAG